MAQFCIEIAGSIAAVTSLFESTPHHFRSYLTDREPDFSIEIIDADLRFEQADADAEAAEEGFRRRVFPDPFLERAAIQRKFAAHLLKKNVLLVHGSTVAVDGNAYLFTARSGTGKSTHTRLWREVFGNRAKMVNDDKPFLAITESGILACGSPWSGKHGLDSNICVPLRGICLLERGTENRIRPAVAAEVIELLKGYRPQDSGEQVCYQQLLEQLVRQVPLWHMDCTKDPEAARLAFETMSQT